MYMRNFVSVFNSGCLLVPSWYHRNPELKIEGNNPILFNYTATQYNLWSGVWEGSGNFSVIVYVCVRHCWFTIQIYVICSGSRSSILLLSMGIYWHQICAEHSPPSKDPYYTKGSALQKRNQQRSKSGHDPTGSHISCDHAAVPRNWTHKTSKGHDRATRLEESNQSATR